ncbi:hypothetical protein T265_14493, partial [Opisthorchis viverrini]
TSFESYAALYKFPRNLRKYPSPIVHFLCQNTTTTGSSIDESGTPITSPKCGHVRLFRLVNLNASNTSFESYAALYKFPRNLRKYKPAHPLFMSKYNNNWVVDR